MIEEYKRTVLHELGKAGSKEGVKQIINRSVDRFPENDLFRYLVIIYLHILQNELQKPSEQNIISSGKCNIRDALDYLRQMNNKQGKV